MNSEKSPKVSEMSDVLIAKGILVDTFDLETNGRSLVIGRAIAALKRVERALSREVLRERNREWTERRVRSILDEEARRIDAYEIEDLKRVQLEEARHDYQRSAARAARLAEMLAHRDPDFHGPEIEAQMAMARGLGRTGNDVADNGPHRGSASAGVNGQRSGRLDRSGNSGAAE